MLGYENAIVRAKDDEEISNISGLCFFIALGLVSTVFFLFKLGEYFDIKFFTTFPSLYLLICCLFASALFNILSNLSNRYEKYTIMSMANVVLGGSQGALRILFGSAIIVAVNGLILGTTLAQVVNVIFYIICLSSLLTKNFFKRISIQRMKTLMQVYKQFPLYDAPACLLAFSAFNLPILILSAYFSKAEIGCYSIVIQLLLMPMSFIGSAMGRVYYRQISECRENWQTLKSITTKVLKTTAIISILPLFFIAVGGDKVIILFLGTKWGTAGSVALCLALWSFPTVLTQPLIPLFRVMNCQRNMLAYDLLYFIGGIGSILISLLFTHNLYIVLIIYASMTALSRFLLFRRILSLAGLDLQVINLKLWLLWAFPLIVLCVRLIVLINASI